MRRGIRGMKKTEKGFGSEDEFRAVYRNYVKLRQVRNELRPYDLAF